MSNETLEKLIDHTRQTAILASVDELLNWDQRTLMPKSAETYRADQITLINGMVHQRNTDPRLGEWLAELVDQYPADSTDDAAVTVHRLYKQYNKEKNVPARLVEEISRARVKAHSAWVGARETNSFADFAPYLETIVKLFKEKTEAIGFGDCAYDVLLDDYEPDAKTSEVTAVFAELKDGLVPLIREIGESKYRPDKSIIERRFDIAAQRKFGLKAASAIGFDFDAGRLDVTHHPFCCTVGPKDCRITTRYNENHFNGAFFGTLHEAGHGLYEQGLREDQFGLPPGEYCSLGIHESQSRLWENLVGRSKAFWEHFFPKAQSAFANSIGDVTLDQFYGAVNYVEPSLIRVEADEATYSLHIIIRFEIEQAIFDGALDVIDFPAAWNQKYVEYLGIEPPNDSDGVLQDVHWCEGLFGYFPTYALGNLYAAQFFAAAEKEIGDMDSQFRNGEFQPLLNWLRENVHVTGKSRSATGILKAATGETLSPAAMIEGLRKKYSEIYSI
ncbi:carboxypeptidase M32 [bacterium]|jgi:carboxypeptidase Taq|nr:carboxypeptidase M32 [bacterium]